MSAPCPNCRKDGDLFDQSDYKHYCDDEACPVLTYDWNGKYTAETDASRRDMGSDSDE